jgi:hypothetical protein
VGGTAVAGVIGFEGFDFGPADMYQPDCEDAGDAASISGCNFRKAPSDQGMEFMLADVPA